MKSAKGLFNRCPRAILGCATPTDVPFEPHLKKIMCFNVESIYAKRTNASGKIFRSVQLDYENEE